MTDGGGPKGKVSMAASEGRAAFVDGWEFMQTLGEGAYGEVKLAVCKESGDCVAVKIVTVDDSREGLSHESLRKEVCILKMLKHKHVVKFFGQRTQGSTHYLLLEYADGGELFDRIEPDLGMEPGLAHHFFLQLLDGVEYLHSRGVAHRDIKPENILLDGVDTVKISDFGLSTVFRHQGKERKLNRRCGTPPYIAPEVHAGLDYCAEAADVWSCGIVLVAMLAGELPWDAPTSQCAEYVEWCAQNYFFSPWTKISNEPLALLKKILKQTPVKRYTIEQIKSHVWCRKTYAVVDQSSEGVSPSHRPRRPLINSSPRYADRDSSDIPSSLPHPMGRDTVDGEVGVTMESFTQPSRYDELVISTQVPCTPGATETPVQRLTLRLTRFYTTSPCQKVWSRLQQIMKKFCYDVRISPDKVSLVVSTTDKRHQPLVFKASIYGLRSDLLLVDFRRSTGDGIEFKKIFKKVRDQCQDIIVKPP